MRILPCPALLCFLLLATAGCAGLGGFHAERKKRDDETARRLADRRDTAEFQAALNCWDQQDVQGCRERLEPLLTRNPKHRNARLLMADVLVASKQPQEALAQVQELAAERQDDADVQYAMAVLLDGTGRNAEAMPYYERAARLAPANEVYAGGYRMARPTARQEPAGAATASSSSDATSGPPAQPYTTVRPPQLAGSSDASREPRSRNAGGNGQIGPADNAPGSEQVQQGCKALSDGQPETALACFRKAAAMKPHNPQILTSAAAAALKYNQPRVAIALLEGEVAGSKGQPDKPPPLRACAGFSLWPTTARETITHPNLLSSKHFRWTSPMPCPTF